MNRADSYQAGRADGERWAEKDIRDYYIGREEILRNEARLALFFSDLGPTAAAEAAYRLGVLRGYRQVTR